MKLLRDLKKEDLTGKKVLLRVDFNVAREGDRIVEDFKIRSHQKTIDYLLACGAQVACVTYTTEKGLSFGPVAQKIGEILKKEFVFVPSVAGRDLVAGFQKGPLVLAENARLFPGEKENDDAHAQKIADGFDVYINDAFASSHRAEASLVAITRHLPSYAGFVMEKETTELGAALSMPEEGKIIVLGGKKIESKLPVIRNLLDKAERILIGGAVANNFYKFKGLEVGKSLIDPDYVEQIRDLDMKKILLPEFVVVSTDTTGNSFVRSAPEKDVLPEEFILDIGPKMAQRYAEIIKSASMVIWSGAMGMFEVPAFAQGTRIIAEAVASSPHSIIGGGDTISAVDHFGLRDEFTYVSTGGGAMLEFLAGKRLPALEALGYYG